MAKTFGFVFDGHSLPRNDPRRGMTRNEALRQYGILAPQPQRGAIRSDPLLGQSFQGLGLRPRQQELQRPKVTPWVGVKRPEVPDRAHGAFAAEGLNPKWDETKFYRIVGKGGSAMKQFNVIYIYIYLPTSIDIHFLNVRKPLNKTWFPGGYLIVSLKILIKLMFQYCPSYVDYLLLFCSINCIIYIYIYTASQ